VLEERSLDYKPSMLGLTSMVNDVARKLLTVVAVVPRLEEQLPANIPGYAATDAAIAAAIAKITAGGMAGSAAVRLATAAADEGGKEEEAAGVLAAAVASATSGSVAAIGAAGAAAGGPPPPPTFFDIVSNDKDILDLMANITRGVADATPELQKKRAEFERYNYLWVSDKANFMRRYALNARPLLRIDGDMQNFQTKEQEIVKDTNQPFLHRFIRIDFSVLRATLLEMSHSWKRQVTKLLNDTARNDLDALYTTMSESTKALTTPITDFASLNRITRLVKTLRADQEANQAKFGPLEQMYAALAKYEVPVDESETLRLAGLHAAWDTFLTVLEAGEEQVRKAKTVQKKELAGELGEAGGLCRVVAGRCYRRPSLPLHPSPPPFVRPLQTR